MSNLTRRKFFRWGLGTAGTLVATRALGAACQTDESTAVQPLGPFFPNEGTPQHPVREDNDPSLPTYLANDNDLTFVKNRNQNAQGEVVTIKGRLTNADCSPIANATLIIWQASSTGRYNHLGDEENHSFVHPVTGVTIERVLDENFQYWGKARTDADGNYEFKTVVPGFYPADLQGQWYRPPHIHFLVKSTGIENFVTQMYFRGPDIKDNDYIQELNSKDFLLHNPNLTAQDKETLIVDFKKDPATFSSQGLLGTFDIQLKS